MRSTLARVAFLRLVRSWCSELAATAGAVVDHRHEALPGGLPLLLWQAVPGPSNLSDRIRAVGPRLRRPCFLVRVVAGHQPAFFVAFHTQPRLPAVPHHCALFPQFPQHLRRRPTTVRNSSASHAVQSSPAGNPGTPVLRPTAMRRTASRSEPWSSHSARNRRVKATDGSAFRSAPCLTAVERLPATLLPPAGAPPLDVARFSAKLEPPSSLSPPRPMPIPPS